MLEYLFLMAISAIVIFGGSFIYTIFYYDAGRINHVYILTSETTHYKTELKPTGAYIGYRSFGIHCSFEDKPKYQTQTFYVLFKNGTYKKVNCRSEYSTFKHLGEMAVKITPPMLQEQLNGYRKNHTRSIIVVSILAVCLVGYGIYKISQREDDNFVRPEISQEEAHQEIVDILDSYGLVSDDVDIERSYVSIEELDLHGYVYSADVRCDNFDKLPGYKMADVFRDIENADIVANIYIYCGEDEYYDISTDDSISIYRNSEKIHEDYSQGAARDRGAYLYVENSINSRNQLAISR